MVARQSIAPSFKEIAVKEIDEKLADALAYDALIFPMNAPGDHDSLRGVCDHWTSLVFYEAERKWILYNSKLPHEGETDWHCIHAKILVGISK